MDCPGCLGANLASARTCEHCGAPLPSACAGCGAALPPDARFCSACGRAAVTGPGETTSNRSGEGPAAPRGGERRPITVLFADIVGSTGLAERLDPEDYRAVVERGLEAFETAIRRHDGTVAQLLGDGILAFFGAPAAHDDDPIRAAAAAHEIVAAAGDIADELQPRGIEFAARVGIDTGLVVVGPVGGDPRREYLAMGDPVNVAARLQALAPPMGILLTPAAAALVNSRFEVHEHGTVDLRGRTAAMMAWALGPAVAAGGRSPGADSGPIVGRVPELAALRSAVDALVAGLGRIALIVGEPGLGKSRLVLECRELVRATGRVTWIEVAGVAHGERSGYQLVTSLARALLGDGGPHAGPDRSRIDAAIPSASPLRTGALAQLLGSAMTEAERADLSPLEPAHLPRAYADALRDLLRARAQRGPLALVIEDIQWADPSSVDIVVQLLGVVDDHPVLIVLVSRPEPTAAGWRLVGAARDQAGAGLIELTLEPLDAAGTDELAARYVGAGSPYLPIVRERSDGNPLFVEELARSLAERTGSGADERDGSAAIPDALQGVLLARLDRLPASTRTTARVAAVIGRRFPLDVLEAAAGIATVRADLAALGRAGLVQLAVPSGPVEFAFRHVLIQEAAYASLLRADARRLHEAVARALAALRADDPSLAPTLARHFASAGLHGDALGWFRMALDRARAAFANEEALALLESALVSAAALQADGETDLDHTVADLQRERGDVLALVGRASEARSAYQAALAQLPEGDIVGRSGLLRRIGPTLEAEQRYADAEAAYRAAESVLGEPRDDPVWWRAWLDVRLRYCELLYWAGRIGEMERVIGELEGPVRLHGDGQQRGDFHSRTAMMLEQRDVYRPDEVVIEHQRAALREMQALGSMSGIMYQQFALGFAEMWGGHLEEAERDMVASRALAARIGDAATVARGDAYIAVLDRFRHRRREALEAGERTLEASSSLGPQFQPYVGIGHAMRGSASLEIGDLDGARAELDEGIAALDAWAAIRGSRYPMEWIARLPLLAVELREGRLDRASDLARHLIDPCQQVLPPSVDGPLRAAVELASEGDHETEVRRYLEAAVAAAEAEGRI